MPSFCLGAVFAGPDAGRHRHGLRRARRRRLLRRGPADRMPDERLPDRPGALAGKLDGAFAAADGTGLDLSLSGPRRDREVRWRSGDRLGSDGTSSSGSATWSVNLRTSLGSAQLTADFAGRETRVNLVRDPQRVPRPATRSSRRSRLSLTRQQAGGAAAGADGERGIAGARGDVAPGGCGVGAPAERLQGRRRGSVKVDQLAVFRRASARSRKRERVRRPLGAQRHRAQPGARRASSAAPGSRRAPPARGRRRPAPGAARHRARTSDPPAAGATRSRGPATRLGAASRAAASRPLLQNEKANVAGISVRRDERREARQPPDEHARVRRR